MYLDSTFLSLACIVGFIMSRMFKEDISKDIEHANEQIHRLEQDIVYYKKLTKNVVEENTELRKKVNAT